MKNAPSKSPVSYTHLDVYKRQELGCGKGGFLARLASRNPDVNYIGVDSTDKVLILAKRNIERIYAEQGLPIDNVKTLAHDIERIPTLLDKADRVERILSLIHI